MAMHGGVTFGYPYTNRRVDHIYPALEQIHFRVYIASSLHPSCLPYAACTFYAYAVNSGSFPATTSLAIDLSKCGPGRKRARF